MVINTSAKEADVATVITTDDNRDRSRSRRGQQKNSSLKIFLHRHGHVVDFICSFTLVCLCLIVLLPQVHDSFLEPARHPDNHENEVVSMQVEDLVTTTADVTPTNHVHHHHHNGFPAGEFLVCLGFFVFYCVGFSLEGRPVDDEFEQDVLSEQSNRRRVSQRRQSTTCCSSTKCPPVKPSNVPQQAHVIESDWKISSSGRAVDELSLLAPRSSQADANEDCLMLLNPHHQHHTHSKHHDMAQIKSPGSSKKGLGPAFYGSITNNKGGKRLHMDNTSDSEGVVQKYVRVSSRPDTKIIVDEIRIISEPADSFVPLPWPSSLKMLIISVIMVAFLVFLNIRIHGMLVVVKVFRACSTGALLYVAFFIMLPRDRVGCKPCQDEEN